MQAYRSDFDETFEPAKYKDTVRERMLDTIQRKIDGQDITVMSAELRHQDARPE